jgi:predicted anti-sigma-YlaC factor YlaD
MQCAAFERRLQRQLDCRMSPESDAPLVRHAAVCAKCQQRMAAQEQLFAGLRSSPPCDVQPDFATRIVAKVEILRRRESASRQFVWSSLAAIAAAVLIALIPQGLSLRRSGRTAIGRNDRPMTGYLPAAMTPRHDVASGRRDASDSSLAGPAAWPSVDAADIPEGLQHFVRLISAQKIDRLEPVNEITLGFQPLTSTLATAIAAIRSAIPVGQPATGTKSEAG